MSYLPPISEVVVSRNCVDGIVVVGGTRHEGSPGILFYDCEHYTFSNNSDIRIISLDYQYSIITLYMGTYNIPTS